MPALPLNAPNLNLENFKKGAPLNTHQKDRYSLIKRLLDQTPKMKKGLDYGCGLGDVTYHMSGHFDSIIGVDVTPQRVEWANVNYAPLQFHVCDAKTLDFPDGSFDTVLSSVVINWADNPDLYLANIRRVLVTGGHLVILVKADMIRSLIRFLRGRKVNADSTFKDISMDLLAKMLSPNFKIISTDCLYEKFSEVPLTPKNIIAEIIRLPFRLFKAHGYADYYGILAQKIR